MRALQHLEVQDTDFWQSSHGVLRASSKMGARGPHLHLGREQAVNAPRGADDVAILKKGESQS